MGIRKHSLRNSLAITLAIIFLASNLGIAKVSHYCRMAQASIDVDCCGATTQEPSCCNPETEKNDGCCTSKVQIFKADYQSPVPSFSILKIKASNVETDYSTFVKYSFCIPSNYGTRTWHFETIRPPGPSALLLHSVFLI